MLHVAGEVAVTDQSAADETPQCAVVEARVVDPTVAFAPSDPADLEPKSIQPPERSFRVGPHRTVNRFRAGVVRNPAEHLAHCRLKFRQGVSDGRELHLGAQADCRESANDRGYRSPVHLTDIILYHCIGPAALAIKSAK